MLRTVNELISDKRLEVYKGQSNNSLPMLLHRYNFNIELGNEFYPLLNIFEVAFRNSLHLAWGSYLNDPSWLLNYQNHTFLQIREQNKILEAITELREKKKTIEEGRVIAELNLGFWINLFDRPYLEINKKTIKVQFPEATNKQRDIFQIKEQLNDIRKLRNRVFHHGPIWHWSNLHDYVRNFKNLIQWLNKDLLLPRVVKSETNLVELIERQKLMLK